MITEFISIILSALFVLYVHANYLIALISSVTFSHTPPKAKGKTLPKVSVIIATKNEENVIEETLKSVRESDYPRNKLEIIVVDSSTDNTYNIAKKYADKVIIDKKGGKAAALNKGVEAAKHDVLYFLDGDSVVDRNTIKTLVSRISIEYPACTGLILRKNENSIIAKISRMQNIFLFFVIQTWLQRFMKTSFVAGRNYAVYKKELLKLGGFDDVVGEDINLSYRLYREGKRVLYLPEAIISEGGPTRLQQFWKQQERWFSGISHEVRKAYRKINLYDSFVRLPMISFLTSSNALSLAMLITYLFTGNYAFLAGTLLAFLISFCGSIKYLNKKDMALLPVTHYLYGAIQALVFLNLFIKRLLNIKVKWEKPVERKDDK